MTAHRSENSPRQGGSIVLAPFRLVYGIYAIVLFLLLGLSTLVLVLVVPGVGRRRAVARAVSRTFFLLAGDAARRERSRSPACGAVCSRVEPCELPRRGRVHSCPTRPILVRHQAGNERRTPCGVAAAAPRLAFRRTLQSESGRGGGCTARVARRHEWQFARLLPGRHLHEDPGTSEVSHWGVYHGDPRGMSHSAGDGEGYPCGALADRWPTASGAYRSSDSRGDHPPSGGRR